MRRLLEPQALMDAASRVDQERLRAMRREIEIVAPTRRRPDNRGDRCAPKPRCTVNSQANAATAAWWPTS